MLRGLVHCGICERKMQGIVMVDERRQEERIVTVYEPDPDLWSPGYRRRC